MPFVMMILVMVLSMAGTVSNQVTQYAMVEMEKADHLQSYYLAESAFAYAQAKQRTDALEFEDSWTIEPYGTLSYQVASQSEYQIVIECRGVSGDCVTTMMRSLPVISQTEEEQ